MRSEYYLKGFQGIFFDEKAQTQLSKLQKGQSKIISNNMCVIFKRGITEEYSQSLVGKEFSIKVIGYGFNEEKSVFAVEIPKELKNFYKSSYIPHIIAFDIDGNIIENIGNVKLKKIEENIQITGRLGYYIYGIGQVYSNKIIEKNNKKHVKKNVKILFVPNEMDKDEFDKRLLEPIIEINHNGKVELSSKVDVLNDGVNLNEKKCIDYEECFEIQSNYNTIIVRQLNLKVLVKIAILIGMANESNKFWEAVEHLNLTGVNNLIYMEPQIKEKILAAQLCFMKFNNCNYTDITDITDKVFEYLNILDKIDKYDEILIKKGKEFKEEHQKYVEKYLFFENENIRVFNFPNKVFCFDLYYSREQQRAIPCVIIRVEEEKIIIVSMEDGGKVFPANYVLKNIFGNNVIGDSEISRTSNEVQTSEQDLKKVANFVHNLYQMKNDIIF